MDTTRWLTRAAAVTIAASVTGLLAAAPAAAHITAHADGEQLEQGGHGAITLRVPNEDPDHGTTRVAVSIPEEYALASARTKPVPGWSAEVTTSELSEPVTDELHGTEHDEVVTEIVWEAEDDAEISAGLTEYQEFTFLAGPLPSDVDQLVLPASQTYEDGEVIDWDSPPSEEDGDHDHDGDHDDHDGDHDGEHGAGEAAHPAPVIALAAAGDSHEHGEGGHGDGGHGDGAASEEADSDAAALAGEDSTARWLAGAGLALGGLGLGVGLGATVTARRARQTEPTGPPAPNSSDNEGTTETGGVQ